MLWPLQGRDGKAALRTFCLNPPHIGMLKPQNKTLFQLIQSRQKTNSSFHWRAASETAGQPSRTARVYHRQGQRCSGRQQERGQARRRRQQQGSSSRINVSLPADAREPRHTAAAERSSRRCYLKPMHNICSFRVRSPEGATASVLSPPEVLPHTGTPGNCFSHAHGGKVRRCEVLTEVLSLQKLQEFQEPLGRTLR